MFGVSIEMKGTVMKKLAAFVALLSVGVCAFGAGWPEEYFRYVGASARPMVEAINSYGDQNGVSNLGPTVNGFASSGDVSITGDIDATGGAEFGSLASTGRVGAGSLAVTGGSTVSTLRATGRIIETYASVIPVTNAQILLMTSRIANYSAAAQGDITCTNVLAIPGYTGTGVFVTVNNVGVSNAILLSKTTAILGPAISIAPTGSVTLLGYDTNSWIVTGKYP